MFLSDLLRSLNGSDAINANIYNLFDEDFDCTLIFLDLFHYDLFNLPDSRNRSICRFCHEEGLPLMPTTDRPAHEGWRQVTTDLEIVATYAKSPVDPLPARPHSWA